MSEEKTARDAMEASRVEVMESEQEIQSIKNSLKSLAMGTDGATMNSLRVSVHKITSASDSSEVKPTKFKIHLSSPIEERVITKLYDPLDPTAEGSFAEFTQIEAANALVTIEAFSDAPAGEGGEEEPTKLGLSAAHDLLPLCEGGEKKSIMVDFAIVSENEGAAGEDPASAEQRADADVAITEEDGKDDDKDATLEKASPPENPDVERVEKPEETHEDLVLEGEKGAEEVIADDKNAGVEKSEHTDDIDKKAVEATITEKIDEAAPSEVELMESLDAPKSRLQLPIFTLSVQMEFIPSPTDKRDALYDKLNEVSKRKAAAIEKLRQSASAVNRAKATSEFGEGKEKGEANKSQVVKSGFLNKPPGGEGKSAGKPPFWKKWYDKTVGPSSLLWVIGPVAKNYVIFLGISLFFHYKGDLLALPPPV
ncbi:hypothetical protein ACHAXS_004626 [Conticribra weissflogii]